MAVVWLLLLFAVARAAAEDVYADLKPDTSEETQKIASIGVIYRLLGDRSNLFDIKVDFNLAVDGGDSFSIVKSQESPVVSVTGSSGVAAAWGVNYYLTEYCDCHVSWDGDQLSLPDVLPDVNVVKTTFDRWRYHMNVVTYGYSYVWWDWGRWERELDWMALNGINIALAFTAQEAIWERTYNKLGLNNFDFTGAAFLPWNRMGNMRVFGGGLTFNWHRNQIWLQHQILNRMRELGITPVLPAFAGMLPKSFKTVYPSSNVTDMSRWNGFGDEHCCSSLLDPNDEMFQRISVEFITEYVAEFGTNHIYNCDTFNENDPSSNDPEYLSSISRIIYDGITAADSKGIWMIQGWMFIDSFWGKEQVKAYVTGVPIGKLLILDLQSELRPQYDRLESYFGQPFIWCMLHNFGGNLGLSGNLDKVNEGVVKGREFQNTTMVGIGITPEGIDTNYVLYQFTLESAFRNKTVDLYNWVKKFATKRYGVESVLLQDTWVIARNTVHAQEGGAHPRYVIVERPTLDRSEQSWYPVKEFNKAFVNLVAESNRTELQQSGLFKHDLVDYARQVAQNLFYKHYQLQVAAYNVQNMIDISTNASYLIGLYDDLDEILASNKKFLLGNWLKNAKSFGVNSDEVINYEYLARNQITLWGPNGEIRDYGSKQWSGLMKDYYRARWFIFNDYLQQAVINNVTVDVGRMHEDMYRIVENPFTKDTTVYDTEPKGDTIQLVQRFYQKYLNELRTD